jgi:hypothetical protein
MNHRDQMRRRLAGSAPLGYTIYGPGAMKPPASVELRIDRLILPGVAPGDRYDIAAAVQSELARLLAQQSAQANFYAPVDESRIDAGSIQIDSSMRAVQVGEQIAQAIHGCLGPATNTAGRMPRS